MLDLIRMGKVTMASTTSVSPSPEGLIKFEKILIFLRIRLY